MCTQYMSPVGKPAGCSWTLITFFTYLDKIIKSTSVTSNFKLCWSNVIDNSGIRTEALNFWLFTTGHVGTQGEVEILGHWMNNQTRKKSIH